MQFGYFAHYVRYQVHTELIQEKVLNDFLWSNNKKRKIIERFVMILRLMEIFWNRTNNNKRMILKIENKLGRRIAFVTI
jgi:hypothetical protein